MNIGKDQWTMNLQEQNGALAQKLKAARQQRDDLAEAVRSFLKHPMHVVGDDFHAMVPSGVIAYMTEALAKLEEKP